MTRKLLFVHGRAQQRHDALGLKGEWIAALSEGLAKSGLSLPLTESDVRFPYYGDTLFDLDQGANGDEVAAVIVRGDGPPGEDEREFMRSVLEEMRRSAGITQQQITDVEGAQVIEKGPLNWGWVRRILKAIDKYVPGASGSGIALATHDVYSYLSSPGVRDTIEEGIRAAISSGEPTVVVAHSLGTVVAYNLLRREGAQQGWIVPLLVTVGSPLAVTAIKRALRPIHHPACVTHWYNAMDARDIVALYPLDPGHFDVNPSIENKTNVDNQTSNHHGISGYLNDKDVARHVFTALTP